MNIWWHGILYVMMMIQMVAWMLFSLKGGKLADRNFLIFTVGMLSGQIGAGIETYIMEAWGAFAIQVFFFAFTAIGGIQRLRQMRV